MTAKKRRERIIIVDADSLIYSAAANAETKLDWEGNGEIDFTFNLDMAKSSLGDSVLYLKKKLKASHMILAVSDYENFRKEIMPTYKAHRAKLRKPQGLGDLKKYLMSDFHAIRRPKLEADDVVGILATKVPENEKDLLYGRERMIVSGDKDLLTIPGLHYSLTMKRQLTVSLEEADYRHMFQTLTGDPTDGYKGCPGVGPKKAEKLLASVPRAEWWPAIVNAYKERGCEQPEQEALLNARVARICRASDYDFKNKQVILWVPVQTANVDTSDVTLTR